MHRDMRGKDVWKRLENEHTSSERNHYPRSHSRYHPYQRSSNESLRESRGTRRTPPRTQTWHPKNREQTNRSLLDTPNSRVSDPHKGAIDTRSNMQQTVTEVVQTGEEYQNRARGSMITHTRDLESEKMRKFKAPAIELTKAEKLQRDLSRDFQPGTLTIRDQNPPLPQSPYKTPESNMEMVQDPEGITTLNQPTNDLLMDNPMEGGLTAAEINYMINELADDDMDEDMFANDDLLGAELEDEAEQIEAISQLSPIVLQGMRLKPRFRKK
ncbi:unnamed protein product [Microthlaspi erraticum]|uniref:Uncharacterized protein n=1 Tax=Microthlaspi erraticum TaxID=1685480 RepID=A0A6D2HK59_9BRAS|nr:unnamed protein product [Microthlaspi erraticum]